MTTISPILQQRIANQQVAPTQVQVQTPVNLEQKPDSVEISNSNTDTNTDAKPTKGKVAKYALIAFTAAAAIAGIAAILKGKNTTDVSPLQKNIDTMTDEANKLLSDAQEMQKEALNMVEEANKVMEEAQAKFEKMKKEVIDLFNNGGIKDGNKIAQIEEKDGASFMKEFDSGNNLIRESKFVDSKLSQIDEITQNGTNIYCVDDKGKLSKYTEGFEILPDGTEKYAKRMDVECRFMAYTEGFERSTGGREKCAKYMDVEYQFMTYTEEFERSTGGREKCAKIGHLKDGGLYEYIEGYNKNLIDGTESYAKRIEKNENGKWVEVKES